MTDLTRRAFLRRLGFGTVAAAAAATGVVDLERLLWVPGERTIVIPAAVIESTLNVGDVITIAGRYAIDPVTRKATRRLQTFTIIGAADGVVGASRRKIEIVPGIR